MISHPSLISAKLDGTRTLTLYIIDWTHYSLDNAKLAILRRQIGDRLAEYSSSRASKDESE